MLEDLVVSLSEPLASEGIIVLSSLLDRVKLIVIVKSFSQGLLSALLVNRQLADPAFHRVELQLLFSLHELSLEFVAWRFALDGLN